MATTKTKTKRCKRCLVNHYTPYSETIHRGDPPYPALSRVGDGIYICSDCGNDEAMMDYCRERLPERFEWPVTKRPWQTPEEA